MIELINVLLKVEYDGQLSVTAYLILVVILMGIIFGFGWCFYRAITATDKSEQPQLPSEVGNGG